MILTEYELQKTLNPKLWSGTQLKPKLHAAFMKIANHFYDFLEINVPIQDVILIGSNANYNWTNHSDVDLHVVINFAEIGDNRHLVENYLHAKKSLWNNNYPLEYRGLPIELYAQDSNDNLHSTVGIYSIQNEKWIQKPSYQNISIDNEAISQKAQPYEYEIDKLKSNDPALTTKIKNILQRLKKLRQSGLEVQGEFALENLAFKYLRNKGYIARLKDLLHTDTLGQLQIENITNAPLHTNILEDLALHITKQQILDDSGWQRVSDSLHAITDPTGQWSHPGRCTIIPSGNITMQRVPHRVLGIDDTGHMQLMQPEQQYTYPGGKVLEIPHTPQWQTMIMQLMNKLRNGGAYGK